MRILHPTALVAALSLSSSCASRAHQEPKTWVGPPIFHLHCPQDRRVDIIPTDHRYQGPIPRNIKSSLDNSDVLYVEITKSFDVQSTVDSELKKHPVQAESLPLRDGFISQLSQEDRTRLRNLLARHGTSEEALFKIKPTAAYLKIVEYINIDKNRFYGNAASDSGGHKSKVSPLDDRIEEYAISKGIRVSSLDSGESLIQQHIAQVERIRTDKIAVLSWLLKVDEKIASYHDTPFDYESINLDKINFSRSIVALDYDTSSRESLWLQRFLKESNAKRITIAVGAGHTSPENGFPRMLVNHAGCTIQ